MTWISPLVEISSTARIISSVTNPYVLSDVTHIWGLKSYQATFFLFCEPIFCAMLFFMLFYCKFLSHLSFHLFYLGILGLPSWGCCDVSGQKGMRVKVHKRGAAKSFLKQPYLRTLLMSPSVFKMRLYSDTHSRRALPWDQHYEIDINENWTRAGRWCFSTFSDSFQDTTQH